MIGLTHRMRDCQLIVQDLADAGIAPTVRAIAREGCWSVTDAARLADALIERGWLRRLGGQRNSPLQILIRLQPAPDFEFTVTPEGEKALREGRT
ncbi:MAG: hypothetical protein Dbin4_02616 [Alphaproteobacteria bacterium]|nr:hypothetical protein [Alphaproteobacteria bacterium]